jgi:peptide subunit release factor 1 (eRF1)
MITRDQLSELARREPRAEGVLTAYVHVDQSDAANLNGAYETRLRNVLKECATHVAGTGEEQAFETAVGRFEEFLDGYSPAGKGLFLFCDPHEPLFVHHVLEVPTRTDARWSPMPYVRPLAEAYDEFERFGVILTDRAHARLFIVTLGEIQERAQEEADEDVHQFDASGKDQRWSQMHFQRKQDLHATHHLKAVAERMTRMAERREFDRLILGGPEPTPSELRDLLPDALRERVIGTLSLPLDAPESRILDETQALARAQERSDEDALIENLITVASKDGRAVITPRDTVTACLEGRVHRLIYAQGVDLREEACPDCSGPIDQARRVSGDEGPFAVLPADDLVEWMVEAALRQGGEIEHVRDDAAQRLLNEARGVGALLRF